MKVCIIDDNQSITGMFSKLLKMEGHEVVVANDGRSGLSLLENAKFDATILDISMPEFSGIDVVNALNESGKIKDQRIVILTASSTDNAELDKLKEKGVRQVLKKPLQLDSLVATLETVSKS
ncbi:MAG: Response regulator [Nitrosopumilales archaeon]|nr:MAG: Response regulator [Nitrosopumilales archaeon]